MGRPVAAQNADEAARQPPVETPAAAMSPGRRGSTPPAHTAVAVRVPTVRDRPARANIRQW